LCPRIANCLLAIRPEVKFLPPAPLKIAKTTANFFQEFFAP